jgi:tetratricopeptide (TPR) repeat protein
MDFEVADVAGTLSFIGPPARHGAHESVDWFRRGEALESSDPAGAETAYRQAIKDRPTLAAPYLNLGALLCEAGRCHEAVDLYRGALGEVGHEPIVHFNLAIALEDQDDIEGAMNSYERALQLDSDFADAHFNLGMLLQNTGNVQGALRHFNAYRRLDREEGS